MSEDQTFSRRNVETDRIISKPAATQVRCGLFAIRQATNNPNANIGKYSRCSNAASALGMMLEVGARRMKNARADQPQIRRRINHALTINRVIPAAVKKPPA